MCNKKQLITDVAVLAVCILLATVFSATIGKFVIAEFSKDFGLNITDTKTTLIFSLFLGYAVAGYITGFIVIKNLSGGDFVGMIIAFLCGHIVGFFLLPIRIIKNIVCLVIDIVRKPS